MAKRPLGRRIGYLSRLVSPGYGACHRCHTTWRFVPGHVTHYTTSHAMFPLCEQCWSELTPDERLPYYHERFFSWPRDYADWTAVKQAVLEGL